MIYTVTFNPSLDYVVSVDNFAMGKINRASDTERLVPGGKGINVSMVLDNLGIENRAICFSAGFTGEILKNLLKDRKVNADFINLEEGNTRINVKLKAGLETEINALGPVVKEQYIGILYEKLDYLDEEDFLVLAGSVPATMPDTVYRDIAQRMQYNKCNLIVDAAGDLLLNVLPYKPFLIKPNLDELRSLFDAEINSQDEIVTYAGKLMEKGARNVLVSMGEMGAVLLTEKGNVQSYKAPAGIVKNSVGAGDAMLAGFLSGYIKDRDYVKALRMGICTGSASAFSDELATKEEVEKLLEVGF